jgi:hypothetical protein
VTSTDCSITILHHQLQDLLKRRWFHDALEI